MRYINFLNENIDKHLEGNEVFNLTKQNLFVYRGVRHKIKTFEVLNRRKDRRPTDMPIHLHRDFNNLFQKKFGFKLRSEGVFTSSSKGIASYYGINSIMFGDTSGAYIFVPIKPYKFYYSLLVKDLYMDIGSEGSINLKLLTPYESDLIIHNEPLILAPNLKKKYDEILERIVNSYTNKNLKQAIPLEHEIVFDCDKYILFNVDYFKEKYLL